MFVCSNVWMFVCLSFYFFLPTLCSPVKRPWIMVRGRFVCLSACLPVSLPVCLSVSADLSVPLFKDLESWLEADLSVFPFVCLLVGFCRSLCFPAQRLWILVWGRFVCLSVCPFACLPVCLSVCLFVCLSVSADLSVSLFKDCESRLKAVFFC